jgi:hypothetical protein
MEHERPLHGFRFESFGVKVEVAGNDPDLIKDARDVATRALVGMLRPIDNAEVDHLFELNIGDDGVYYSRLNGDDLSSDERRAAFLNFYDGILRVTVGEYARDRVFVHAGAVAWKGKAILIPADSFKGKSTLVAELVKRGAVYYSDEFAILDSDGMVHPFPRPIAMRTDEADYKMYELDPANIGGTIALGPASVGSIVFTEYDPLDGNNELEAISPGQGLLRIIPFTLCLRRQPEFTMNVLNKITSHAIITSGRRGPADSFAETLLNFVDKHAT